MVEKSICLFEKKHVSGVCFIENSCICIFFFKKHLVSVVCSCLKQHVVFKLVFKQQMIVFANILVLLKPVVLSVCTCTIYVRIPVDTFFTCFCR